DAAHQAFIGYVDQPLRLDLRLAGDIHAAAVAIPAIQDRRHVDIEDIAIFELLRAGDAMTDNMVDGNTDGFRIAAIVERAGDGAARGDKFRADAIQLLRRDAGDDIFGDHVKRLGGQTAGLAHCLERLGTMQLDHAGIALRRGYTCFIFHQDTSFVGNYTSKRIARKPGNDRNRRSEPYLFGRYVAVIA